MAFGTTCASRLQSADASCLRETRDCRAAAEVVLQQAEKVSTSDNSVVIAVALNVLDAALKRARRFQLNLIQLESPASSPHNGPVGNRPGLPS